MKHIRRIATMLLVLSLLLGLCAPAMAASDSAVGTTLRLEETTGAVTVKTSGGKEKKITKDMRLLNGYTVETGKSSTAYISLDGSKAVKLDALGKVEVKKSGQKLEVLLTSGQIYFNVTEPLKADESLNIRTSTMVTGIRGSFGWMTPEVVAFMHGHGSVFSYDDATGITAVAELTSGQMVTAERIESQLAEQAASVTTPGAVTEGTVQVEGQEIVPEAVPSSVTDEINKDPVNQQLMEKDTNLSLEQLNEVYADTKANENAKVENAEQAFTQGQQTQNAAISANDAAEKAAGVKETLPFEGTTSGAGGGGGGSSDDSGDDSGYSGAGVTYYTVTVDVAQAEHCTVNAQRSYSVPAGGGFSFTVTREAGYDGGYTTYAFTGLASGASAPGYTSTAASGVTTVTVSNVSSNATLHVVFIAAYVMQLSDLTTLADVADALNRYKQVDLHFDNITGQTNQHDQSSLKYWYPSDQTLTVGQGQYLQITGGHPVLGTSAAGASASGQITVLGEMRIQSGGLSGNNVKINVESGGVFTNAGEVFAEITVAQGGELNNIQSAVMMLEDSSKNVGTFNNYATATIYGTLTNAGTLTNTGKLNISAEAALINSSGGTLDNTSGTLNNEDGGTIQNYGRILN